ncbi:acetyltransferase, partial [mine drainage metagenome]
MELKSGDIELLTDIPEDCAEELAELANDPAIRMNIGSHSFPLPYSRDDALDFMRLNRELFGKKFRIDFYIHFREELSGVIE